MVFNESDKIRSETFIGQFWSNFNFYSPIHIPRDLLNDDEVAYAYLSSSCIGWSRSTSS